ncbi:MAG: efflux RND transporter periplasmic adaptor subunit [Acidobacteriota bacterium]
MSLTETEAPPRPDLSALRIHRDAPPRRRRLMPAWLVVIVVLLGVASVAWTFLRGMTVFQPTVETGAVLVERPSSGAQAVLTATGYVVARTKASISAKVAGRLEALEVEEGSRVKAGDLLAQIEHRDIAARAEASRAAVAEARARLVSAQARRDQAQAELRRQKKLLKDGVGMQAAFDEAERDARTGDASVAEAEAGVQTAAAELRVAEVALEDTNVRAPFDGTILRKEADIGESVAPAVAAGQLTRGAIVTMADLSQLDVEADVSESNVARVTPDLHAEVSLDAVPDRRYRGKVRQVMPTADRQKGSVMVKVAIQDPDDRVKPEMSAKVTFLSAAPDEKALSAPPVTTAPKRAIVVAGSRASAWVVADGTAARRALQVGETRGDRVVVTSGLSEGESVILDPAPDLRDGQKVKVKS